MEFKWKEADSKFECRFNAGDAYVVFVREDSPKIRKGLGQV